MRNGEKRQAWVMAQNISQLWDSRHMLAALLAKIPADTCSESHRFLSLAQLKLNVWHLYQSPRPENRCKLQRSTWSSQINMKYSLYQRSERMSSGLPL